MLATLAGCGPKAQLREDPFLPSSRGSRASVPSAPPQRDVFQEASNAARDRDFSRGVSTSPSTDPFVDPNQRDLTAAGDASAATNDHRRYPVNDARPQAWDDSAQESTPKNLPATSQLDPSSTSLAADYQTVRQRLDKIGARNIRSEKDEATGDYLFHCEIARPDDPHLLRVFEASDPDELKAMLAVTESAERFLATPR